ncbi:MAG: methionine synthase [Gemmataceae bacterium]|nr:methionine synthase [Gemmataceae bacterium]
MKSLFLELLDRRVVVLDGAMGTSIHRMHPKPADWGGDHLTNLSDAVTLSRPDWIRDIHRGFFAAGCDAVETNTFNGSKHVLAEFGLGDRCREINRLGAQLAREAAAEFSTPDQPRFVVGSIGPGTKMPSILQDSIYITFDDLVAAYSEQIHGLIDGEVDALLIETVFDILQAKAVIITALDVMRERGVRLPLMVQVTVQQDGRMLPGTDIAGALTTLESFPEIDVIGLNCAVGPDLMLSSVAHLSQYCTRKISVLPNAGLPEKRGEETYFPLQPDELADWQARFVTEFGVNIVGGCCGTTAEHLKAVADRVHKLTPATRSPKSVPSLSSLFGAVELAQEPRPLLVGERTNTNGSKKFKQLLEAEDWTGLVEMAREQEREGVHVLDVCTAYVGRDEVRDMQETVKRYNAVITKPLMIDTTEVSVLESTLKLISGKAIINSINLEDGRHKLDKICALARRYGAALVALTIDEVGQADTAEWKFQVAKRIYDICTQEFGIPPTDLLFDPLVFPLTTGQEQTRKSAMATFDAIKMIKDKLPGAMTHVGLSNCSFGLTPYTRQVLNSMYLHFAMEAGLDSAILHAAKIIPLAQIDPEGQELCRRLLFDDRSTGDPLQQLIGHYGDKKASAAKSGASLGDTIEERLRQAIIQGRRETLSADLETARGKYPPLEIINNILLEGMKVVGELFGSGQMQLPFVLQSAEVMKEAVGQLEPFMEKFEGSEKGRIVLATVKGDVHDIGKNLVDIILSNNGYKVFNLGIKQPIETMISEFQKQSADAIGMSGLLVKSTVVMKEDLITLNSRGLAPPVILGGAALNRRYVEEDLRRIYKGQLYYGEDAFAGLRIMDDLAAAKRVRQVGSAVIAGLGNRPAVVSDPIVQDVDCCEVHANIRRSLYARTLPVNDDIPAAPFVGSRVLTDIPVGEVFEFLNERTLFGTQWQFRKNGVPPREYARQMRDIAEPALARLKEMCLAENILRPASVIGFYPAVADGDDLKVGDERFTFPRQDHGEHLCLSDYHRPDAGDFVAMMAVTAGAEVSRRCWELKESGKYQDYLFLHGLGVEFAEALAEWTHREIRRMWGIAGKDSPDVKKLFKKHYRGCRYSFGYPACPRLEDQAGLFRLLEPQRIGIALSEQFQLEPEQSTTAMVVHHPQAKYFNVTLAR